MRRLFVITAIAALLLTPLMARAVTASKTVEYRTAYEQTQPMPAAGAYVGRMTLHFYSDGTVNGTYRDEFAGGFHPVAGGVSGSKIWLSFGQGARRQLHGTIGSGGVITGSLTNFRGPTVYKFTATPISK